VEGETESGPAALRGFCLLNSLFTSLFCCCGGECLLRGPCCGGGGGVGGMGLVNGVMGDGVSTVPLSFKSTVVLVQFIGSAQVIESVGSFSFSW